MVGRQFPCAQRLGREMVFNTAWYLCVFAFATGRSSSLIGSKVDSLTVFETAPYSDRLVV